mgnify:CR=1 FL=1
MTQMKDSVILAFLEREDLDLRRLLTPELFQQALLLTLLRLLTLDDASPLYLPLLPWSPLATASASPCQRPPSAPNSRNSPAFRPFC